MKKIFLLTTYQRLYNSWQNGENWCLKTKILEQSLLFAVLFVISARDDPPNLFIAVVSRYVWKKDVEKLHWLGI